MKWRPSLNGGVKTIIIPSDDIWTPDILHYQSVFEEFETKFETNVEVSYDGSCSWLPPAILYSSCEVMARDQSKFWAKNEIFLPNKFFVYREEANRLIVLRENFLSRIFKKIEV